VLIALTKWLLANKANLKYSYRIVLVPETIGSICYLSKHLSHLQKNLIAGFQVSCIGDDRAYSYVASRYGNNLADKVVKNVLVDLANEGKENLKTFSFLERGSDERQYCAPFIDLPVCGVCRSKYGEYPEYHTSADDLSLISKAGLNVVLNFLQKSIIKLEQAS
jgi:aminopeptidase-like protein